MSFFKLASFPQLQIVRLVIHSTDSLLKKLMIACQRRHYTLTDDWHFSINQYPNEKLNGIVKIPREHKGKTLQFDGASIPATWLVSMLTFGVLRPMGAMLTASFAHDFAYWFGYVLISKDGGKNFAPVMLERHETDQLFRDLISEINHLPSVAYIAWMFVRLGWFFVAYNGVARTGRRPYVDILPLMFGILLGLIIITIFPTTIVCFLLMAYAVFWAILWFKQSQNTQEELAD